MRRAITAFFRFCLRIFFRRIELLGMERVPSSRAVVFAVNHPNGLVDPLFLLCFAPARVSFLAKAPLFGYPIIGSIVRAFDTIPVYRKQEVGNRSLAEANAQMFARAREVLQHGGSIAIFPEGTTHDDPKLRELKTGAARIALGANVEAMTVIPTGIYYTEKHAFRSSVLVLFGEPIHVQPLGMEGEPPVDDVDRLTAAIDAGLDAVTLQAESHTALELIARAENIFTADEDQPLIEEFDLRRRFLEGYHYLSRTDPRRLAKLEHAMARLEAELRTARIDVHELQPRIDAGHLLLTLLLLPFALVGAIGHWPAYLLVDALTKRFSKGERNMMATVKFLAALALYPVTYIAMAFLIGWRFGAIPGAGALFFVPLLGYLALRIMEEMRDLSGDFRALRYRMFRSYGHARLVTRRQEIRDEMLSVAREMGR